ncbi:MAG: FAD-binding oxidoreductase, partial [Acidimicrobiales bacterium]
MLNRLGSPRVELAEDFLARLGGACDEVALDDESCIEAGRDWWPLGLRWATRGMVPSRAGAVARPSDAGQVSAVLSLCNSSGVPVTAMAGRSGVCGGSVPVFGGVSLDMSRISGLSRVDDKSLVVDVAPGTYGDDLEHTLRDQHGLTMGHWPQSMSLSTVGGWVACRSAGQYSTRYGKIEDMVAGLEVALADGRLVRTGGRAPRSAVGPDLNQLFVGSEGTLGVVTEASFRVHPLPEGDRRGAWSFPGVVEGLDACRKILARGATPAVLRLYDEKESARSFDIQEGCVLVVLDEGDPFLVDAVMQVVSSECSTAGAGVADTTLVQR